MNQVENLKQKPSFERTLAFVSDERVSSFPIDTKALTPPMRMVSSPSEWERNWAIAGQYLGTDKTLKEIGNQYGITTERVRQIVKSGLDQLHEIQKPNIQNEFPLDSLSYRRPPSIASRRRYSAAKGGVSNRVEQAIADGMSLQEIKKEVEPGQISRSRKSLNNWGTVKVPYETTPILPRFEMLKDPTLTDEKKQELLDSVKNHREVSVLASGNEPLIISVTNIARLAGLHFRNDKTVIIYNALKSEDIPASSFLYKVTITKKNKHRSEPTYYFMCTSDKKRAIAAIQGASELEQFGLKNCNINPKTY